MNVRDIMSFINHLEKKYPVDLWVIEGIHIWPAIRFQIYFTLYEKYTFDPSILEKQAEKGLINKVKMLTELVISLVKSLFLLLAKPTDFGFFVSNVDALLFDDASYINYNSKFYNRFTDPVTDDLKSKGKKSYTISLYENYSTPRHSRTKHVKAYLRLKILFSRFTKKLHSLNFYLADYEAFYNEIVAFDKSLEFLFKERIVRYGLSIIILKKYFTKILNKANPAVIFQISYYNIFGLSISYAAKCLDIPCVEIQHGTQNDLHVGYGLWTNIPQEGFNTLPSIFATWDDISCTTITHWSNQKHHKAFVFGNRFLERFKIPSVNQETEFYAKYQIANQELKPQKNILLTLQNLFGLPDIFFDMLQNSPQNYLWWIRFHPMMTNEIPSIIKKLKQLQNVNYETDQATRQTLYSILPHMDAHVTLNSSVVLEALQFGVASIVCDETAKEYYVDGLNNGDFVLATTADTILDAIKNLPPRQNTLDKINPENLYNILGL